MIRQKQFAIGLMILLFAMAQVTPVHAIGMAKLVIKVVDEGGKPMEGAKVELQFQGGGLEKDATRGETDDQGIYSSSGYSSDGVTGGGVDKDGYYTSVFHHDFYRKNLGMWQPWGKELTVVMRPIVNPVPMYVRNRWFEIPEVGKEIGFDLMKADWVIPYGQGTTADFIFKVDRRYGSNIDFDATLTLTFSNPYDGIQLFKDDGGGDFNVGSWFRLPRTAPNAGYEPKLVKSLSTKSPDFYANNPDDDNFLFRVRSEVDGEGKLKRAMYGKIRGAVLVEPRSSKTGKIKMYYYLNPDYTPNLEFEPQRNLFISLPSNENVRQP